MSPLDLFVDALAAYRLTRLVTADTILDAPRDAIATWSESGPDSSEAWRPKIGELVECRWCAGVWISLGVVAARRLAPAAWEPVARVLAFSTVAALLARAEDDA